MSRMVAWECGLLLQLVLTWVLVVILTVPAVVLDGQASSTGNVSGSFSNTLASDSHLAGNLSSVSITPSSVTMSTGSAANFAATISCTGGTCPPGTTYSWSLTNTIASLNATAGSMVAVTAGPSAGNTTLLVNATLNGVSKGASAAIAIFSPPTITSFTASPSKLRVGQSTNLSVIVTGGTGALSYTYTGLPQGCISADVARLTCTPTVAGSFQVTVAVVDSAGHATTAKTSLTVMQTLSAAMTESTTSGSAPLTVSFQGMASGGSPPYIYSWNYGDGSAGSGQSSTYTYGTAGSYTPTLTVTDANASTASATGTAITVSGGTGFQITSFTASPDPLIIGNSTTLSTAVAGGVSPYSYLYSGLPAGCVSMNTSSLSCEPVRAGVFSIRVTVTDAAHSSLNASAQLTVIGGCGPSCSITFEELGLPSGTYWPLTILGRVIGSVAPEPIVIGVPNGTYDFVVGSVNGFAAIPASGNVVVSGNQLFVNITFVSDTYYGYALTFVESGLAPGTIWSVNVYLPQGGHGLISTNSTIEITGLTNGSYSFWIGAVPGYTVSTPTGNVTLLGSSTTMSVMFTPLPPGNYSVIFSQGEGLPAGVQWSVRLGGVGMNSTGQEVAFAERNGTFPFTVGPVPGYKSIPASGSVTVDGSAVGVVIYTIPVDEYLINFTEKGLPVIGTVVGLNIVPRWGISLTCGGSSSGGSGEGTSFVFAAVNGTCTFAVRPPTGYAVAPASGTLNVAGASLTTTLVFSSLYNVTLTEVGLPTGASWTVILAGQTMSSTGSTLAFTEPNGTYNYTVTSLTGYTATPSSGSLTILGRAVSQTVIFTRSSTRATYTVTFTESGLPSGTNWSVTLNGSIRGSTTSTITFMEPNGTYAWNVTAPSGYTASKSSGSVSVTGENVDGASLMFTKVMHSGFLGLSGDTGYILLGVSMAAVIAALALVLVRGRGKSPSTFPRKAQVEKAEVSPVEESGPTPPTPPKE